MIYLGRRAELRPAQKANSRKLSEGDKQRQGENELTTHQFLACYRPCLHGIVLAPWSFPLLLSPVVLARLNPHIKHAGISRLIMQHGDRIQGFQRLYPSCMPGDARRDRLKAKSDAILRASHLPYCRGSTKLFRGAAVLTGSFTPTFPGER